LVKRCDSYFFYCKATRLFGELLATLRRPESHRHARALPPQSRYGFSSRKGDFGANARVLWAVDSRLWRRTPPAIRVSGAKVAVELSRSQGRHVGIHAAHRCVEADRLADFPPFSKVVGLALKVMVIAGQATAGIGPRLIVRVPASAPMARDEHGRRGEADWGREAHRRRILRSGR
jgi:hypothetical protein